MRNKREICGGCSKQIYYHNKIIICNSCSVISHYQCFQNSNFKLFQSASAESPAIWYCNPCFEHHGVKRYNPFLEILSSHTAGVSENSEFDEDLQKISDCLQNCKMFETVSELNADMKKVLKKKLTTPLSIFFNNLDGNSTNFDGITVELKKYDHKFSAISLCETNIDSLHKSLYNI